MKRLLVANRSEIALRVARTARELGIATLGVYAAEDEALAHGYGCDEIVALKASGPAAYLDPKALIAIASAHGCDTLHPGYGFLSESSNLSAACADAGIAFVGPDAETLALFGDKPRAREHAETLGVAVVPGIAAPADAAQVRALFASVNKDSADPVAIVIKAVAGGGGRGMRVVRGEDEVESALQRCQSEAERAFGVRDVFAELWIESARHIEVQIAADDTGHVTHLWERDCSLQRRHQKLIEVAPAPSLEREVRSRLLESAQLLAEKAGLCGVGTFEFLVTPSNDAFFMEANPRLQVEHPVTEEMTGIDLVEIQLRIAKGESLESMGLAEPPPPRGFSIELRLLAETLRDTGELRPSAGTLTDVRWPGGAGVRVDTALRPGLAAHPAFDSMIAKIIVSSPSSEFERVVARATRALRELHIGGIDTNRDMLLALLDRSEFTRYAVDTGFIAAHAPALLESARQHTRALSAEDDPATQTERVAADSAGAGNRTNATPNTSPDAQAPDGTTAVCAPLLGTLIQASVADGDEVAIGQNLAVLEAMKMEHVVCAEVAGRVVRSLARKGDVVSEGAALFWIQISSEQTHTRSNEAAASLDTIRPDLAEVGARLALLQDAARPEAVERRRTRGQRTARENLTALCDRDSFVEYGGLAVAAQRRARPIDDLQKRTPADAIITGTATVNADRFGEEAARCAVLVADATVLAGTQGFFHHQKIDRILGVAERHKIPIVFFPEGGGGRPNDSDAGDISTAGLTVTSFGAFAKLSGQVPRVSVVSGFCFAGSAAFAGCADVIIATQGANLGMGGPAMIEGGGLGVYPPEKIGPTSVQEANGVIDLLVKDEVEAVAAAKRYLGYFQGLERSWTFADQRGLRHLIPENRRRAYDIRSVITTLADDNSVFELRRNFGIGMITALIRIEGHAFGLIANDPMHLGGAIDDVGSDKAARFLQLCDAFGLPILSLCDTPGFMVGPEIEAQAQVRKVSRLFVTGASLRVPLFTIILRKGYGLGAQAMAGGSFGAPVLNFAWPTGEIGGMGLEGAVDLGFKKSLNEQPDAEARAALRAKLIDALYEKGKALNAASQLEFDGVIDPADTRATIVAGLRSVGPIVGSARMVDTW